MDSERVDRHREEHSAFNRRDLPAAARHFRPDARYTDHARGLTVTGPADFTGLLRAWIAMFPDVAVSDSRYLDAGEHTVARFRAQGTNSGTPGAVPAVHRRLDVALCEVLRYDAEGRVSYGELFYDAMGAIGAMGVTVRLGDLVPPAPA
jgi:hypothetical protein